MGRFCTIGLGGAGGNDLINGKEGGDILIGGRGADTLVGEAGADVFRYLSHLDSPAGASTRDFINGFEHGQDKIDLTALDGNLSTAAREGFRFISGQAFSGSAGEIRSFSWGATISTLSRSTSPATPRPICKSSSTKPRKCMRVIS